MILKSGMYVRVPYEKAANYGFRVFFTGQVCLTDEALDELNCIFFDFDHVSDYYSDVVPKPGVLTKIPFRREWIDHAKILPESQVLIDDQMSGSVLSFDREDDEGFFHYFVRLADGRIENVCEKDLKAGMDAGEASPLRQFKRYEFHNPSFAFGKLKAIQAMRSINNKLYGLAQLASAKIFLKPHQIRTVLHCLESLPCRFMIADEVGMGKTIEAISILKIFVHDSQRARILIVVPDQLVAQWNNELNFKFHLFTGPGENESTISLISFSELPKQKTGKYDFVVMDEVHRLLRDSNLYEAALEISRKATNLIMLSATPIQERREEYKKLLTLVLPSKYGLMTNEEFDRLVSIKEDLDGNLFDAYSSINILNGDLSSNETCKELVDDDYRAAVDSIKSIGRLLNDRQYDDFVESLDSLPLVEAVKRMRSIVSYAAENYQFEHSIIRNRRSGSGEYPERKLEKFQYDFRLGTLCENEDKCFFAFSNWCNEQVKNDETFFETTGFPLLTALLSSGHAFYAGLKEICRSVFVPKDILAAAKAWKDEEDKIADDPVSFMDRVGRSGLCRPLAVISRIESVDIGENAKCLIFTSNKETFEYYKKLFLAYFGEDCLCFFQRGMPKDELDLNAYRFQNDPERLYILADDSGGEGYNFQQAAYIIHIDVPWNPSELEQRIGRLDRIGRPSDRPVVSVVVGPKNTIEDDLVTIYEKAFPVFTKAQTGLEIVLGDVQEALYSAVKSDFSYGLSRSVQQLTEYIGRLQRKVLREMQISSPGFAYTRLDESIQKAINFFNDNEKTLFEMAFRYWSKLVGFSPRVLSERDEIVLFSVRTFSPKAAENLCFVPSALKRVLDDKLVAAQNRIRILDGKQKINSPAVIYGTYDRATAVSNDFIHFFAPGDPVFDSVTKNAAFSYRGQTGAFRLSGDFSFAGIVFVYTFEIDEAMKYRKGVNPRLINEYKTFLKMGAVQKEFYPLDGSDEETIAEAQKLFKTNFSNIKNLNRIDHLGKRSEDRIKLFKAKYPPEIWGEIVDEAFSSTYEKVKKDWDESAKAGIEKASEEIDAVIGLNRNTSRFFNERPDAMILEKEKENILEILASSHPVLSGVYYMEVDQKDGL